MKERCLTGRKTGERCSWKCGEIISVSKSKRCITVKKRRLPLNHQFPTWAKSRTRRRLYLVDRELSILADDQPGFCVPPYHVRPQLASWMVSGAGGWPPRLLCGRTVL